jgi:hypothetical protein
MGKYEDILTAVGRAAPPPKYNGLLAPMAAGAMGEQE